MRKFPADGALAAARAAQSVCQNIEVTQEMLHEDFSRRPIHGAVSNGLQASVALKEEFSGVGAVVSYLADKGDETF